MPFPATHPSLARALEAQGYREPTPVQAAVLEAEADRDLLVSAQTGSGKTVAFGLASAAPLLGEAEQFGQAGPPLALVIAPTRELALQVSRELTWLYADTGARRRDLRRRHGPAARAARPGARRAHRRRHPRPPARPPRARQPRPLGRCRSWCSTRPTRCSTWASARTSRKSSTPRRRSAARCCSRRPSPSEIATLAKRYQRDALRIDTIRRDEAHGDIEYRAIRVAPNEIEHAVVNLLRYFEAPGALVFCATREAVRHLHAACASAASPPWRCRASCRQKERTDALQALRDGHARVCVATDVAARGLDLPDLGLVIHADLPVNKAGLLHRSGRTGRAGRKGVSVLVVPLHQPPQGRAAAGLGQHRGRMGGAAVGRRNPRSRPDRACSTIRC